MAILSIQSAVAYGHVGNCAAALPLQRLGHEVWRLDTVTFSNHPGHGRHSGRATPAEDLRSLLAGLEGLGVLRDCEAVLSGYLGEPGQADVVADAVSAARLASSHTLYCLDPVIGDDGRVFVREGVAEAIRDRLVPLADFMLPNAFELAWLTGRPVASLADAATAAARLRKRGPSLVVVTGLVEGDSLVTLALGNDAGWGVRAPRLPGQFNGTGDLFAALFLGWYLTTSSLPEALSRAASGLAVAVAETAASGRRELELVAALERIVEPPELLAVEPLGRPAERLRRSG